MKKNDKRKQHYAYLFWAVVVIAACVADSVFKSPYVTVAKVGIAVLALFRLLSYDKHFMRIHKAFRSASSIETAKLGKDAAAKQSAARAAAVPEGDVFDNSNLNAKLKQNH